MKIDICLISSDLHESYLGTYEYVRKAWNEIIGIPTLLILVADKIPDELLKFKDEIILFKPIEGIHSAFVAQCIRILYPCLLNNKNVIISDADIIPLNKKYFIDSIKDFDEKLFISYTKRYHENKQQAICYNCANSNTWQEIFKINNLDDLNKVLISWYNNNYNGIKNCQGWYTDQEKLYEYLKSWDANRHIIFNDNDLNFNRLDKKDKIFIVNNVKLILDSIKENKYSDYHFIRPYQKYIKLLNSILNTSIRANQ
jgi:hypothetical protein